MKTYYVEVGYNKLGTGQCWRVMGPYGVIQYGGKLNMHYKGKREYWLADKLNEAYKIGFNDCKINHFKA